MHFGLISHGDRHACIDRFQFLNLLHQESIDSLKQRTGNLDSLIPQIPFNIQASEAYKQTFYACMYTLYTHTYTYIQACMYVRTQIQDMKQPQLPKSHNIISLCHFPNGKISPQICVNDASIVRQFRKNVLCRMFIKQC